MDRPHVALPLHGGCFCGAVRYRLDGAPLLVHVCHCHDCQTRSGSVYALIVLVRTADLSVSGPLRTARRTTGRGAMVDDNACPTCDVRLLASAVAAPEYTSLRGGTFDDASWAVPIAQTWTESAIPWAILPGVRQVDPSTLDYNALGEAWRATAPVFTAA